MSRINFNNKLRQAELKRPTHRDEEFDEDYERSWGPRPDPKEEAEIKDKPFGGKGTIEELKKQKPIIFEKITKNFGQADNPMQQAFTKELLDKHWPGFEQAVQKYNKYIDSTSFMKYIMDTQRSEPKTSYDKYRPPGVSISTTQELLDKIKAKAGGDPQKEARYLQELTDLYEALKAEIESLNAPD